MARRVMAVETRRHAAPAQKIESWRKERADVMGGLSYAGSGGGGGVCGAGFGLVGVELEFGLTGGADDLVIIRMMGSFCRVSMGLRTAWDGFAKGGRAIGASVLNEGGG